MRLIQTILIQNQSVPLGLSRRGSPDCHFVSHQRQRIALERYRAVPTHNELLPGGFRNQPLPETSLASIAAPADSASRRGILSGRDNRPKFLRAVRLPPFLAGEKGLSPAPVPATFPLQPASHPDTPSRWWPAGGTRPPLAARSGRLAIDGHSEVLGPTRTTPRARTPGAGHPLGTQSGDHARSDARHAPGSGLLFLDRPARRGILCALRP